MLPSVGRIVHYVSNQGAAAALVIRVENETTVDLQVFRPDGEIRRVTYVEQGGGLGQWNWPPRV